MGRACSTSRSTCVCILAESGGRQVSETEISDDANYGFAVAPVMMIKPLFVFIPHPDQTTVTAPSGNDTPALLFGAMFAGDLAHLSGLPTPGG
jgi:hypothetical protein